jgi:predicted nuclease of predicted toxin-antitoxin system
VATIRFHLDEHVSPAVASGLRHLAIDVTTTQDAGLLGASDDAHIAFALAQGRVTFTQDDDFLALSSQGVEHAGIAYCRQHSRSIDEIIHGLEMIHGVYEADEMRNRVEFI